MNDDDMTITKQKGQEPNVTFKPASLHQIKPNERATAKMLKVLEQARAPIEANNAKHIVCAVIQDDGNIMLLHGGQDMPNTEIIGVLEFFKFNQLVESMGLLPPVEGEGG